MPHITRRTSALAGVAVMPFFVGVIILVTRLERDYLRAQGWALTQEQEVPYPSVLVRGDLGWLQELNYVAAAILIATFTIGFRREFRRTWPGRIATAGFSTAVAGILLNLAPTDLPGEEASWHGTVHLVGFLVMALGLTIAFISSGLALRGNPGWRGWRFLGWTPAIMVILLFTGAGLPGDLSFCAFIVVTFGWFTVMGAHLLAMDAAATRASAARLPDATAPGLL